MINDVTSAVAPENIQQLIAVINTNSLSKQERKTLNILQDWDGSNQIEDIAPTIYNKFIYTYLKNTFEDEIGEKLFTQLLNTHLMKRMIADQLQKKHLFGGIM